MQSLQCLSVSTPMPVSVSKSVAAEADVDVVYCGVSDANKAVQSHRQTCLCFVITLSPNTIFSERDAIPRIAHSSGVGLSMPL